MSNRELFHVINQENGITRFQDCGATYFYLVEGEKQAALIDTGAGFGNAFAFAKTITDLPIIVLLSHGHVDHAGGIYDCDGAELYLSKPNWDMVAEETAVKMRRAYIELQYGNLQPLGIPCPEIMEEDFTPPKPVEFHDVVDGQKFDLGGRTIVAVRCSAHTDGYTMYLDEKTGTIFAGDYGALTSLVFKTSTTIEVARESFVAVKQTYGNAIKRWYLSHFAEEAPLSVLDGLIDCMETILAGKNCGQAFTFDWGELPIGSPYDEFTYEVGPDLQRLDGGFCNVGFNSKRVREEHA